MKRNESTESVRAYRSKLRDDQAKATRELILAGMFALIRQGHVDISYRDLAKQVGVSLPTVYRHFPTREALIAELRLYGEAHSGSLPKRFDRASLAEYSKLFFGAFDEPDGQFSGVGRLVNTWDLSRTITVPRRRRDFAAILDDLAPGLPDPERTRLLDLCVVLLSSAAGEAFRGYLGRTGAETSEIVKLGLEAIFNHAAGLTPKEQP